MLTECETHHDWKKEELKHSLKRIQDMRVDLMDYDGSDSATSALQAAEDKLEEFLKSKLKKKENMEGQ